MVFLFLPLYISLFLRLFCSYSYSFYDLKWLQQRISFTAGFFDRKRKKIETFIIYIYMVYTLKRAYDIYQQIFRAHLWRVAHSIINIAIRTQTVNAIENPIIHHIDHKAGYAFELRILKYSMLCHLKPFLAPFFFVAQYSVCLVVCCCCCFFFVCTFFPHFHSRNERMSWNRMVFRSLFWLIYSATVTSLWHFSNRKLLNFPSHPHQQITNSLHEWENVGRFGNKQMTQ